MSVLACVNGRIDADCPHRSGITITVTVIILASVTRSPNVDVSKSVPTFVDAPDNGSHGGVARSINSSSVVSRSPTSAVNIDEVRFVTHWVGFNEVGHIRLIEHPDSGDHAVVGDAYAADAVVPGTRNLSGTSSPVAVEPVIGVTRIRVRVRCCWNRSLPWRSKNQLKYDNILNTAKCKDHT